MTNTKTITLTTLTNEQAITVIDALKMLNVEAEKMIEDGDLIAPLVREADATIINCESLIWLIQDLFGFTDESE